MCYYVNIGMISVQSLIYTPISLIFTSKYFLRLFPYVGYPNQDYILVYRDIPSRNIKQDSQDIFPPKVFPLFLYTADLEFPNSESPLCLKIAF